MSSKSLLADDTAVLKNKKQKKDYGTYTEPAKKLKIYGKYDIIVVGGGTAGFAAAVASARNNAKTLIIEQFPYFGGSATASLMAVINGFRNQVEPNSLQTTKGIGEEVILRLKQIGGLGETHYKCKQYPTTKGNLPFSCTIDIEKFKYITLKMAVEAGFDILFHTWFTEVIKEGNKVTGVIFENKSDRQAAFAKVIIDASGDGDVAFKAGADYWQTKYDEAPRLEDILMYELSSPSNAPFEGVRQNSQTVVRWGPKAEYIDATNADDLTAAEIKTRLALYEHVEDLKKRKPEFEDVIITETGPRLGIRQTRFIEGLYKITGEDVLAGKMFDDSIAMASKPVIRYYGYRRYLKHTGYSIPYRCLLPKKVSGLITAGRCISSDQPAFESWRSMVPCMSIGEAAGTAAALSVANAVEPKKLDIKLLQQQLIKQGAEIGQNKSKA
jgi:hypothetical protein